MDRTNRQQHQHHQKRDTDDTDDPAMIEMLDLDGEVLHSSLSDLTAWVGELMAGRPPRRILDVGSGTGTGTLALLERFEGATATALDLSAHVLHHLESRARALGMADRVHTVQADLDEAWPDIDAVDLVWASASMHHLADPDRVLTEVFARLRPGGLLVVVELDSFPLFLPDDIGIGRPGLEARCHAVLAADRAAHLPHLDSDWGARLVNAGFAVEAERIVAIDLEAPLPAATGRYAQLCLQRIRSSLDGRLSGDDVATLESLLDGDGPDTIARRSDLGVRTDRTVWVGRRP